MNIIDNREYEKKFNSEGYTLICGCDEAGRGPLCGPVVAGAVILPQNYFIEGLTDSKKLTAKRRDYFFDIIKRDAISYGIGIVSAQEIDKINIYEASRLAMLKAIDAMEVVPDYILTDAMPLPTKENSLAIIKGDQKSITISAASILAKVTRDRIMDELDTKYPMYGFKKHKGYPTKLHLENIEKYGILDNYRLTYKPIKKYLESEHEITTKN